MSTRLRFGIVVIALEVQFWFPVWLLFLLDRGFTTGQAALADGLFRLVATACEVPVGYLSDRIGRKKSLYLALGGTAATFLLIASVQNAFDLAVAWTAWGVVWALVSGLLTACGWELGMQTGGKGASEAVRFVRIRRVCAAAAMLVSLLTAGLLYDARPALPFTITALLAAAAIPVAAGLPDIAREADSAQASLPGGIRALKRPAAAPMRLALGAAAVVLVAGWSIQMVFQPLGLEAGLDARSISVLFAGYAVAQLVGAWCVGRVKWSRVPVLVGSVLGTAVLCLGVWTGFRAGAPAISLACLILLGLCYSVGTAYGDIWVSGLAHTSNRATMLSLSSLLGGAFMIFTRPALGMIAGEASAAAAFGIWAVVCCFLTLALWAVLAKRKTLAGAEDVAEST